MINPWPIIAGLLFWLASVAGAAWLGYDYKAGKVAQEIAKAQADTLQQAIAAAETDKEAAVERAEKEATARATAAAAKSKGQTDANLKANANCSRDADSMRLLSEAIDTANGATATAGRMSVSLSRPPQAD